jgi:hypothetical protein
MGNIPLEHEASLLRMTSAGEEVVRRGPMRDLVGNFLSLPPERQRGLSIRASGRDWTRQLDEWTLRELAARPEFSAIRDRTEDLHEEGRPALVDAGAAAATAEPAR